MNEWMGWMPRIAYWGGGEGKIMMARGGKGAQLVPDDGRTEKERKEHPRREEEEDDDEEEGRKDE